MSDAVSVITTGAALILATAFIIYLFREEKPQPEPVPTEGGLNLTSEEKEMFIPTSDWQPVLDNHICPAGLEYKININEGTKFARLVQ